ncbi:MAG TPA: hypothetical protein VFG31_06285 [Conexibacter sp.]|nr:hypothetical protein [Conexibacter sp.]
MDAVQADASEEVERLRAHVAELERELVAQAQRTNRVVAEAQRRTYWLDRWQLDLDAVMRRRALGPAVDVAFRAARKLGRGLRRARRRDAPVP